MDFLTHDTEREIFKFLLENGCCLTCCLRLIGTQTLDRFVNPTESCKTLRYVAESFEVSEEAPCVACLGILQPNIQQLVLDRIMEAINFEYYDCSTFTCTLSIPISLKPRERSLETAIQQKFALTENQLSHLKLKIESIKDTWKTQMLPKITSLTSKQLICGPVPSPFLIDVALIHEEDESDCKTLLKKCDPSINERKKNIKYSRNSIEKILLNIDDEKFAEIFSIPPKRPSGFVMVEKISCSHTNIFIGGRYTKLSRQLSQTPWFINGEKKMETSVQDLLCGPLLDAVKADSLKFLSSGREDVDVRTINSGRPFAIELVNPRRTLISADEMKQIVEKINSSTNLVQVTSNLRILDTSDLKTLKEGENKKTKFYRALCVVKNESKDAISLEKLENVKNLRIIQKTPVRVLHRRPLASRTRVLHSVRGRWLTPSETEKLRESTPGRMLKNLFVLDVKTQAGTYVKEFVHGDFGRTKPNLCDLLGEEVDIVALDVTGINLHWP